MYFLRAYSKLASLALGMSRPLWVFKPKLHYYHHILVNMRSVLQQGGEPINPLAYSCSVAEDFIGRASRISRRVAAQTTEKRVLQRYLAAAKVAWDN